MVENLVGYAKEDLMVPLQMDGAPFADLGAPNAAAKSWCNEVNSVMHSEICAVPSDRLSTERGLLAELPSLRPEFGARPTTRKVDKLSCIRFASGRYSVPNKLICQSVTVLVEGQRLRVIEPVTGDVRLAAVRRGYGARTSPPIGTHVARQSRRIEALSTGFEDPNERREGRARSQQGVLDGGCDEAGVAAHRPATPCDEEVVHLR